MKYKFTLIYVLLLFALSLILISIFKPVFILPLSSFTGFEHGLLYPNLTIACKNRINPYLIMENDILCCEIKDYENQLSNTKINVTLLNLNKEIDKIQFVKNSTQNFSEECLHVNFNGDGRIKWDFFDIREDGKASSSSNPINFIAYTKSQIKMKNRDNLYNLLSFTLLIIGVSSGLGPFLSIWIQESTKPKLRRKLRRKK